MGQGGLRDPQQREKVGADHPFQPLGVQVVDPAPARRLEAGVVDEDVERAEQVHGTLRELTCAQLVRQVARQQGDAAPGLPHPVRRLLGVRLLLREVPDRDVGALAGERDGDGAPDPRVPAGDEGSPSDEPARPDVGLLAVVGDGLHRAGGTGGLLLLRREGLLVRHDVPPRKRRWPVADRTPR